VEIQIRGPAGAITPEDDWESDDAHDPLEQEDHYERPKEKFPKGWVKIGVMGWVIKVRNNQTLEQACDTYGLRLMRR
jgi:hypothetical protein